MITLEDKTMLIDTGNYITNAADYLKLQGISKIDYFVLTDFDTENILGAETVLSDLDVGTVIMPDMKTSEMSAPMRARVNKIKEADAQFVIVNESNVNATFKFGDADFTLLTPLTIKYSDECNCYSIAIKLNYGETSFLFMSDTTVENIEMLLASNADLKADIISVSQNGRAKCTSDELLDRVQPDCAVISLPDERFEEHLELVQRLEQRNIDISYVTEEISAAFVSNGKTVVRS